MTTEEVKDGLKSEYCDIRISGFHAQLTQYAMKMEMRYLRRKRLEKP